MSEAADIADASEGSLSPSLATIIRAVLAHRVLSLSIVVVGVLISVAVALVMRPVYRSEVVVVPAGDETGGGALGGLAGQFGGLAALTGIQVGKGGERDEALGVLRSRDSIASYVTAHQLMPILFADDWDAKHNDWRADLKRKPTMGDAIKMFDQGLRQVRVDAKTGRVTVTVEWYDRHLAAEWANGLVKITNEKLRTRAIADANVALESLQGELARADVAEVRNSLARLIESQLKARTFASVRKEFAFKTIDPAVVADADEKVRPARSLIVALGALGSVLLATLVVCCLDVIARMRRTST